MMLASFSRSSLLRWCHSGITARSGRGGGLTTLGCESFVLASPGPGIPLIRHTVFLTRHYQVSPVLSSDGQGEDEELVLPVPAIPRDKVQMNFSRSGGP